MSMDDSEEGIECDKDIYAGNLERDMKCDEEYEEDSLEEANSSPSRTVNPQLL